MHNMRAVPLRRTSSERNDMAEGTKEVVFALYDLIIAAR